MTAVTDARIPRYVAVPAPENPADFTVHQSSSATCDWTQEPARLHVITICGLSLGAGVWLSHREDELPGLPCEKCTFTLERMKGCPR